MNDMAAPSSGRRCSQTCSTPAAVRNRVMNTMAMVISQKPHISSTCERLSMASPIPRRRGMAYEMMVITIIA
ncbi:hypothetical protein D9M73_288440 [compost metagenome]